MDIGKQIRTLRLTKGVTQEELASYLGVSCQAVSKWETQTSTPDIALLPNIAVFLALRLTSCSSFPTRQSLSALRTCSGTSGKSPRKYSIVVFDQPPASGD